MSADLFDIRDINYEIKNYDLVSFNTSSTFSGNTYSVHYDADHRQFDFILNGQSIFLFFLDDLELENTHDHTAIVVNKVYPVGKYVDEVLQGEVSFGLTDDYLLMTLNHNGAQGNGSQGDVSQYRITLNPKEGGVRLVPEKISSSVDSIIDVKLDNTQNIADISELMINKNN